MKYCICPYQNLGNSHNLSTCLEVTWPILRGPCLWNAGSTREASGSGFLCYLVWSLPVNSAGSVDPDGEPMCFTKLVHNRFMFTFPETNIAPEN